MSATAPRAHATAVRPRVNHPGGHSAVALHSAYRYAYFSVKPLVSTVLLRIGAKCVAIEHLTRIQLTLSPADLGFPIPAPVAAAVIVKVILPTNGVPSPADPLATLRRSTSIVTFAEPAPFPHHFETSEDDPDRTLYDTEDGTVRASSSFDERASTVAASETSASVSPSPSKPRRGFLTFPTRARTKSLAPAPDSAGAGIGLPERFRLRAHGRTVSMPTPPVARREYSETSASGNEGEHEDGDGEHHAHHKHRKLVKPRRERKKSRVVSEAAHAVRGTVRSLRSFVADLRGVPRQGAM